MTFLKKEPIDDLNDISYVNPEIEYKSTFKLTYEILTDSIFNIFPIFLVILIDGINLICIGHLFDKTNLLDKFNYFQIAVAYLNLFGVAFALGACKTIKKGTNLQKVLVNTKIVLISLTTFLILPLAISSYYILSNFYANEGPDSINMLWYMYKNFLIGAPLYILFQILLQLNLRALQNLNDRSNCFWIFTSNVLFHLVFLYIFINLLQFEIFGILLSLICSNFICYIFSNAILEDKIYIANNFYFIPNFQDVPSNDICNDFKKTIRSNFLAGFIFYSEYSGFGFFLLFSIFIGKQSLAVNIILMNLFSILHLFGQGFSYTLRHYIRLSVSSYKHSHIGKKKYVKMISLIAFLTALTFSVIILACNHSIFHIYLDTNSILPVSTEKVDTCFHLLFKEVANYYALVIFFDYVSKLLDGYVKGIDAKTSHLLIYKLAFLIIFVPAGIILCFNFQFGLIGFWISIYTYIIIYAIINAVYVYKYYAMWFH